MRDGRAAGARRPERSSFWQSYRAFGVLLSADLPDKRRRGATNAWGTSAGGPAVKTRLLRTDASSFSSYQSMHSAAPAISLKASELPPGLPRRHGEMPNHDGLLSNL